MKIALFSSWVPEISVENTILVTALAKYLVEKDITVVTGGCSGIPGLAIEVAHRCGGKTIGYFPLESHDEYAGRQHEQNIHCIDFYTETHFIFGFTARSLAMIKNVDAAIVLNGRIGTLSEFSIAIEEGLPLAIIEGTGGIADELKYISAVAKKEFPNNEVIFEKDFRKAVDELVERYSAQ